MSGHRFNVTHHCKMAHQEKAAIFKAPGHRDYKRHAREIEPIFTELFPNWPPTDVQNVLDKFGMPRSTLYNWRKKWLSDPTWRPSDTSVHGLHHRVFTDDEEEAIASYIVENYIVPGLMFTNADFQVLVTEAFLTKFKDAPNIPEFTASKGFIQDFKKRNSFVTRRSHPKKRPKRDREKGQMFRERMAELLATVDHDRIVNCDETFWRSYPSDLRTWGKRGTCDVKVYIQGAQKEGLTVLASITASRCKLPLWIIAKGTTERCHAQVGDPQGHLVTHSENGWTTVETFSEYLMSLRERYPDDGPVYLVLDCYSVHRTDEIRQLAKTLGIELIFIPPGLTDEYQPLDRAVFGVMKQHFRQLWRKQYSQNPSEPFTRAKAVQLLVPAWERVSPSVLENAWTIYEDPEEELD